MLLAYLCRSSDSRPFSATARTGSGRGDGGTLGTDRSQSEDAAAVGAATVAASAAGHQAQVGGECAVTSDGIALHVD